MEEKRFGFACSKYTEFLEGCQSQAPVCPSREGPACGFPWNHPEDPG